MRSPERKQVVLDSCEFSRPSSEFKSRIVFWKLYSGGIIFLWNVERRHWARRELSGRERKPRFIKSSRIFVYSTTTKNCQCSYMLRPMKQQLACAVYWSRPIDNTEKYQYSMAFQYVNGWMSINSFCPLVGDIVKWTRADHTSPGRQILCGHRKSISGHKQINLGTGIGETKKYWKT